MSPVRLNHSATSASGRVVKQAARRSPRRRRSSMWSRHGGSSPSQRTSTWSCALARRTFSLLLDRSTRGPPTLHGRPPYTCALPVVRFFFVFHAYRAPSSLLAHAFLPHITRRPHFLHLSARGPPLLLDACVRTPVSSRPLAVNGRTAALSKKFGQAARIVLDAGHFFLYRNVVLVRTLFGPVPRRPASLLYLDLVMSDDEVGPRTRALLPHVENPRLRQTAAGLLFRPFFLPRQTASYY